MKGWEARMNVGAKWKGLEKLLRECNNFIIFIAADLSHPAVLAQNPFTTQRSNFQPTANFFVFDKKKEKWI